MTTQAKNLNPLDKALHERALEIATRFKRDERDLVDVLQKIEDKKTFLRLGFTSCFDYAVKALGLSENVAYNFINVARKSKQVPELKKEIQNGSLSVSKAKKITAIINTKNSSHWIEKAKTLSLHNLQKEIAKASPKEATPEKASYVSEKRLNLQLGVDEDLLKELRRVQDLLSQQKRAPASLEDALKEMTRLYLDQKDPVRKAQRILAKKQKNANSRVSIPPSNGRDITKRKPLPARVKHAIFARDQGQCTHRDDSGRRCGSQRWLDVHHIRFKKHGGLDIEDNLQLLCYNHHRMVHERH
jgi:5-methylcytosine-specific restriction endonuclease McrA